MLFRFVVMISMLYVTCLPLAEGADYKASFDCSKANSSVEKLICGYPNLATLDVKLSQLYKASIASGIDKENILKSQRTWLKNVRNKCKDDECLEKVYRSRINDISNVNVIMPYKKRKLICDNVTKLINDGSINNYFVPMQQIGLEYQNTWIKRYPDMAGRSPSERYDFIDQGETRTFVLLEGGGTCGACDIVDLKSILPVLYPADDAEEHLRWSSWGMCDRLMFSGKEPIVVTGRMGYGESRATLVSWIAPDGINRPLCYLDITGERRAKVIQNDKAELCNAVLQGQVEDVVWKKTLTRLCEKSQDHSAYYPCLEKDAVVDINNDGHDERVGFFGLDSGAGCGARYEWLRQLSLDGKTIDNSITDNVLHYEATGPIPWCDKNDSIFKLHIVRFNGKSYIIGKSHSDNSARVFYLLNDEIQVLCEYKIYPQHNVKIIYGFE